MKQYTKSKKRIHESIVQFFLSMFLLIIIISCFSGAIGLYDNIIELMIICVLPVTIISIMALSLTFKPQYYQLFEIKPDTLYFRCCVDRYNKVPTDVEINYESIQSLKYSGIRHLLRSESLVVISLEKNMVIDANFDNHLDMWNDIINTCKKKNANIIIDSKLTKRLQKLNM